MFALRHQDLIIERPSARVLCIIIILVTENRKQKKQARAYTITHAAYHNITYTSTQQLRAVLQYMLRYYTHIILVQVPHITAQHSSRRIHVRSSPQSKSQEPKSPTFYS